MARRRVAIPATFELGDAVTDFLSDHALALSPKTLRAYGYHVGSLRDFAGQRGVTALTDITPDLVRQWLLIERNRPYSRRGGPQRTMAASTIRNHYSYASRVLDWCVEQERLEINPMKKVRAPKLPQATRHGFEKDELLRMQAQSLTAPGWLAYRDKALITLLIGTGARASELLTLTEDSFDWPRNRVLLHGKGAKDRWVTLGRTASKAVRDYLRARPRGASSFWVSQRHTPLAYGALSMMLGHLGDYCDPPVPNVTAHRFRHTFASEFYRRHKDLLALRNLLGHTKIEVTERYLRSLGVEYGTTTYESPDDWLK